MKLMRKRKKPKEWSVTLGIGDIAIILGVQLLIAKLLGWITW